MSRPTSSSAWSARSAGGGLHAPRVTYFRESRFTLALSVGSTPPSDAAHTAETCMPTALTTCGRSSPIFRVTSMVSSRRPRRNRAALSTTRADVVNLRAPTLVLYCCGSCDSAELPATGRSKSLEGTNACGFNDGHVSRSGPPRSTTEQTHPQDTSAVPVLKIRCRLLPIHPVTAVVFGRTDRSHDRLTLEAPVEGPTSCADFAA